MTAVCRGYHETEPMSNQPDEMPDGSPQQMIGFLVMIAGAIWMGYAVTNLSMTFETSLGQETYNIGLVADKIIHLMLSGFVILAGLILVTTAPRAPRIPRSGTEPVAVLETPGENPNAIIGECSKCGKALTSYTRVVRQGKDWCENHFPS